MKLTPIISAGWDAGGVQLIVLALFAAQAVMLWFHVIRTLRENIHSQRFQMNDRDFQRPTRPQSDGNQSIEIRVAVMETQMERILSDLDSEKGTRARVNANLVEKLDLIDDRQRKMERIIWMGLGGLAVLQFAIPVLFSK